MILDAETKTILAEELDDIALELAMLSADKPLFQQIYSETERLRDTAELYEFEQLTHIATWVLNNIQALKTNPTRFEKQYEEGQYYAWITLLATLLREVDPETQAFFLTELNTDFHQETWSIAINNEHLQHLFAALSTTPIADLDLDLDLNQTIDTNSNNEASYRLAWDDDIHPELLDAFLTETPDLVTETAALIRIISENKADSATHQRAARLAHTVKGSSAVVGVEAIANFAHQLEDVLEHSFEGTLPSAAAECLLESADCLEAMFDSLQTHTTPPSEYPLLLTELENWDKKIQAGEIDEEPASITASTANTTNIDTGIIVTWDDDLHPELLAAYQGETPQNILQISQQLRHISKKNTTPHTKAKTTRTIETYQQIARFAHTLKGSSATVGVSTIVNLAAILENIFDIAIAKPETCTFSKQHGTLLDDSANMLENLYELLLAKGTLPTTYQPLLTQLTAWQTQWETLEDEGNETTKEEVITEKTTAKITELISHTASSRAISLTNTLSTRFKLPPMRTIQPVIITPQNTSKPTSIANKKHPAIKEATLRIPISLIEKLLSFSNELITSNTQLAEYMQILLKDKRAIHEKNERMRNLIDELEIAVSRQSNLHTQQQTQQAASEFDALEMDNYNALHGISILLAETTNDERESSLALIKQFNRLKEQITEQQKINKALNNSVLAMRMESITQIKPRLERIVRETCRQTKKKANFHITGTDIALDTDALKGLLDPLLHLLRNAVDHGIESPEQRKQNNKSPKGEISLNFNQYGDQVLLTLKDDGAGINAEEVYQQALQKGLITTDKVLSHDEKLRLILQAGFSTRQEVSKISGRGVGMDVVNTAVNELSGNLSLHSELGIGTEIQIQIPLSLVAANALLVTLSEHIVAIPSSVIQQIIYLDKNTAQHKQQQLIVNFEEQDIPLLSLSALLDWPISYFNNENAQAIIIVQQFEQRYAFYFDKMMNFQEIVLKTLKPWMSKTHGVNGVCLLQNGVVAPVLNLAELLNNIPPAAFDIQTTANKITTTVTKPIRNHILVVDDSLSNRKALSLTIEPLGYKVSTAIDGTDAITLLEQTAFDLVITDLEMPNMNGLELTEYIREQSDIQHIPIVMVTSRSTEKHRSLAAKSGVNDYLTKPVNKATLKACIETFFGDHTEKTLKKQT